MHPINEPLSAIVPIEDSESLKEWREYEFSLTEKLEKIAGTTQLVLLSQAWQKISWWDRYLLNLQDHFVFSREIFIRSNEKEYWYARTLIPQKCYDLNPSFFQRLERESVKNLIFGEESVVRLKRVSYRIDAQCIEFHWVSKYLNLASLPLWVRFTEYLFQKTESFYLIEILLPELENLK